MEMFLNALGLVAVFASVFFVRAVVRWSRRERLDREFRLVAADPRVQDGQVHRDHYSYVPILSGLYRERKFNVRVIQGDLGEPAHLALTIDVPQRFALAIERSSWSKRVSTLFGAATSHRVGDAEFDETFHVDGGGGQVRDDAAAFVDLQRVRRFLATPKCGSP